MTLHKEAERICNQLEDIEGLCISWMNQADVHKKQGNHNIYLKQTYKSLAKAKEYGFTALAKQIEEIMNKNKDA